MKKILAILLLMAFVAPVFADDALMLPQSVWRFRVIPSGTFIGQQFDADGNRESLDGADSIQVYSLNSALEYGINPWINIAFQWTPGWTYASQFDGADNDIYAQGFNDLFAGAKFQIVGAEAPVKNDMFRFAAATGMIIPISTYDADEEAENAVLGDDFRTRPDNDALGAGYRLYFDYIVNDQFFVNLYNELIYYFPTDQVNFGLAAAYWTAYYQTLAATSDPVQAQQAAEATGSIDEVEVKYGMDLTFEIEPQYSTMIGSGLELSAGLPVTHTYTPETEVDGEGQGDESWSLTVGPSVSFFFQTAPWPIDLELFYSAPVAGKDTQAAHTVGLQIKNYLKFW